MAESNDIVREIARRRVGRRSVEGTVKRNPWSEHDALLNGARNDLRSAQFAHDQADKRYEDAKTEFLRTGEILDRAKARLAELEATPDPVDAASDPP